jgi:hypothetical protein
MSDKKWMQWYVYMDLHEIFFGEFTIILTEWLERLAEKNGRYMDTTLGNWIPELVRQVNYVSNPTTRAIDFWFDSIQGGYVTEFAVDCIQSYNVTERMHEDDIPEEEYMFGEIHKERRYTR